MATNPYYGDPETDAPAPPEPETDSEDAAEPAEEKADSEDAETFLSPKSAVSGEINPGDKIEFEAVHVYDDEIEWKPVKAGKDKPKGKPKPPMPENDYSLDSMAMAK